jgi:hypothetical protein
MMAALIGGMVLVACAGMFTAMEGIDARLQSRFLAQADLQRTRTVVGRTIDTFLMSAEPQRPENSPERVNLPARFILAPDKTAAVDRAATRARLAGAARPESPQRLEVVLSRWPVPRGLAEERRAALGSRAADRVPPPGPGGAVRCAFELRPGRDGTWAMWWRPLPLIENGGRAARDTDPAQDPNAVQLISGLTKCRWTAFDNRERKSEIASTWATDLPAYVELEIETAAGPSANWMFEVAWGNGKEVPEEAPVDQPPAGAEGAPEQNGNQAAPTTPAPRRPARPGGPRRRQGGSP